MEHGSLALFIAQQKTPSHCPKVCEKECEKATTPIIKKDLFTSMFICPA